MRIKETRFIRAAAVLVLVVASCSRNATFDFDVGFDGAWAAEKKLIDRFRAEGFILSGQPYTEGVEIAESGFVRLRN